MSSHWGMVGREWFVGLAVAILATGVLDFHAVAQTTNALVSSPEAPIDFDHARELLTKQHAGQQLTAEEQAYLDRARKAFTQRQGVAPAQQAPIAPTQPGASINKMERTALPEGVSAFRDLDYGGQGMKNQSLDLYVPAKKEALPLIIWIHGGGWAYQDKDPCEALSFLARGYVVASINYRLSDQAIWPAQLDDCKGAIRFLRAHAAEYHIDPNRIGAWGSSAGGHLSAMLEVTGRVASLEGNVGGNMQFSSRVQAVCDWFGPTDLSLFTDPRALALVVKLLGGPIGKTQELSRSASPTTYVSALSKDAPPILIMHGGNDVEVPTNQSQIFYDALKKAGMDATLSLTPNRGHGYEAMATPGNLAMVGDFFDKVLKPSTSGNSDGKGRGVRIN